MSNAKICDACSDIFPEGQEGSISGIGTFTKVVDGVSRQVQQSNDTCAPCVECRPTNTGARLSLNARTTRRD